MKPPPLLLFMLLSKLSKRQSIWNFESKIFAKIRMLDLTWMFFYDLWLMLFQRWWTPISEINKEQFLHYFFKKDKKLSSPLRKKSLILSWGLLWTKSINHIVDQRSIRKRFPKKLKGKLEIIHWHLEHRQPSKYFP